MAHSIVHVPGSTVRLLTQTSKMPCKSWSLPARKACPFAVFGEGTICHDCYAHKGMYSWRTVVNAQDVRFAWTRERMKTEVGRDLFVQTMVDAIRGAEYFRVHDSGDLFSPEYTWCWVHIAQALPDTKFWIPTRSWRPLTMTKISASVKAEWSFALLALGSEPNVTVRPSALFFNAPAPRIAGLQAGSTAAEEGFNCPASTQGNSCGDCRACWNSPELAISYHKH